MNMRLLQFIKHAKSLGLNIHEDRSMEWASASLLRPDDSKKYRLWFEFGVHGEGAKAVSFRWYVGSKFYSHKMSFDRWLTFTQDELQEMAQRIVNANIKHEELANLIKKLPIYLKDGIKLSVR